MKQFPSKGRIQSARSARFAEREIAGSVDRDGISDPRPFGTKQCPPGLGDQGRRCRRFGIGVAANGHRIAAERAKSVRRKLIRE